MMIIVNRQGDMITGSVNGTAFGVTFSEEKYKLMTDLRDKADEVDTMEELHKIVEEFTPLTQESFKEMVETASRYVLVNKHTNKYYLKYGGKVSKHPFPQELTDRILKSLEKGIDITPLVKCWARFLRPVKGRPDYTPARGKLFAQYINALYTDDVRMSKLMTEEGLSEAIARAATTDTQVAITQEGLLVGYKVSEEITKKYVKNEEQDGGIKEVDRFDYDVDEFSGDKSTIKPKHVEDRVFQPAVMRQSGDKFYCGDYLGHIIKVGQVHYLPEWSQVNCNDKSVGVGGLHVGGLRYIQGYQGPGKETHNVFIDPADIGAIVGLGTGNDGAMRVRRYFVHSSFAGPNKGIYHSSKYAAQNDAEYAEYMKEVVEATAMKQKELEETLGFAEALTIINKSNPDGVPGADLSSVLK
jgi:hypothetical protein